MTRVIGRAAAPGDFQGVDMTARANTGDPPPVSIEPEFLSRGNVARLFGVSVSTVTRWARTGVLKAVRTPGGHYRFRAEEIRRVADRGLAGDLIRLD
jgi:excisionase family DNA binding protein